MNQIVEQTVNTLSEMIKVSSNEITNLDNQLEILKDTKIEDEETKKAIRAQRVVQNGNKGTSEKELSNLKKEVLEQLFHNVDPVIKQLNDKRVEFIQESDAKVNEYVLSMTELKREENYNSIEYFLDILELDAGEVEIEQIAQFIDKEAFKYDTSESKSQKLISERLEEIKTDCEEFGITITEYYKHRFNSSIYAKSLIKVVEEVNTSGTKSTQVEVKVDKVSVLKDRLQDKKTTQRTWAQHISTKITPLIKEVVEELELTEEEVTTLLQIIREEV